MKRYAFMYLGIAAACAGAFVYVAMIAWLVRAA